MGKTEGEWRTRRPVRKTGKLHQIFDTLIRTVLKLRHTIRRSDGYGRATKIDVPPFRLDTATVSVLSRVEEKVSLPLLGAIHPSQVWECTRTLGFTERDGGSIKPFVAPVMFGMT